MAEQSGGVSAEAISVDTKDGQAIVRVRVTNPYTNFEMEFAVESVADPNKRLESARLQLRQFAGVLRSAVADKDLLRMAVKTRVRHGWQ